MMFFLINVKAIILESYVVAVTCISQQVQFYNKDLKTRPSMVGD